MTLMFEVINLFGKEMEHRDSQRRHRGSQRLKRGKPSVQLCAFSVSLCVRYYPQSGEYIED